MRIFITTFVFIASHLSFGQIQINWSAPINVAPGFDNYRPRIVLTDGDIPVVMWGTASGPVYTARWNGSSFDSPVVAIDASLDPYCTNWTGPDMAANGNDVWVVADCAFGSDFRVYTVKSTDGGLSYGDTVNVSGYSGLTRFSSIEADGGNPSVIYMNHSAGWSLPDYTVANSADGGLSYGPGVSASNSITGNEVCDCCPPEIAIDGNRQVAMFRNNDNNLRDMWATFSTDNATTFPVGGDIDDSEWVLMSCPSTGPDGFYRGDSLVATWMSGGQGYSRIFVNSTSSIDANTTPTIMVSDIPSSFPQNYPRIDGDDEVFVIVYQQYASGGADIYMAVSINGNTFIDSTDILVSQVTQGGQATPDVAYANGVFHIVYADDFTDNVVYLTAEIGTVGLPESDISGIRIYPNPVSDFLQINGADVADAFVVHSLNGNLIANEELHNGIGKCSLQSVANGEYVVTFLSNRRKISSQNFIVQH